MVQGNGPFRNEKKKVKETRKIKRCGISSRPRFFSSNIFDTESSFFFSLKKKNNVSCIKNADAIIPLKKSKKVAFRGCLKSFFTVVEPRAPLTTTQPTAVISLHVGPQQLVPVPSFVGGRSSRLQPDTAPSHPKKMLLLCWTLPHPS